MTHSENATRLAMTFEGLSLAAYRDPVGVLTIGYGHTGLVTEGDIITEQEAINLLNADMKRADDAVNEYIKVEITQNMFDALVDFTFNLGAGNLEHSTLLRLLNGGSRIAAADEFPKWNKAGGKVLPGLVARRAAERELFLKP